MSLREIRPQTAGINKKEDPGEMSGPLFHHLAYSVFGLIGLIHYWGLSGILACPEFVFVQNLSLSGIRFCLRNNTSRRQKSRS